MREYGPRIVDSLQSLGGVDTPTLTGLTAAGAAALLTALGVTFLTPQGRLTLSSGNPIMGGNISASSVVYYSPHSGNVISLYTGSGFKPRLFTELTNSLTDATKNPAAAVASKVYDLFVWDDAGTLRLSRGPAWSTNSSRGSGAGTTSIGRLAGVLVNTQAIANGPGQYLGTYVGTIATDASGGTVSWIIAGNGASNQQTVLNVWNMYNRVQTIGVQTDQTASHTYNSTTWRAYRGVAQNRIDFVIGYYQEHYEFSIQAQVTPPSLQTGYVGIAFDNDGSVALNQIVPFAAGQTSFTGALYCLVNSNFIGAHYCSACEQAGGTSATTYTDTLRFSLAMIGPM